MIIYPEDSWSDEMIYVFLLMLVSLIIVFIYCWNFSSRICYMKTRSKSVCYKEEVEKGIINPQIESEINHEDIVILSKFGYKIFGRFFPIEKSNKIVILCHGTNCTLFQSYKYRDLFLDLGYSVLMYDQRHHGDTGGRNITYGYCEKHDLVSWIEWVKKTTNNSTLIGIHGESMGAATAILALPLIWQDIKFCIADSVFSDLSQILLYRMKSKNKMYNRILLTITDFIVRLRVGISFQKISPVKSIASNYNVPVMIVHGLADKIVPPQMGLDVYDNIPDTCKKYIFTVINANHCEAIIKDRKGYMESLQKLLKSF